MSSPKAAPGAAAPNVAASLAALLSPARAEASRRNGAKSRGPKTPEGKARSAQNALKHGLRAQKHMVLPGEDAAEFKALEAALIEELAPKGALQAALAQRVVSAVWRLSRAERLEAELFAHNHLAGRSLGLALIRDCNGARSFDTLLRYRGGTLAELWRALRILKALQAERAAQHMPKVAPDLPSEPQADAGVGSVIMPSCVPPAPCEQPIEPEARSNPSRTMPAAPADGPRMSAEAGADAPVRRTEHIGPLPCPRAGIPLELPNEPEARRNPGETAPASGSGGEALVGEAEALHPVQHDATRWVGREGERAFVLRRRYGP